MPYNIDKFIEEALAEDITDFEGNIPTGDHTSLACIPYHKDGRAQLLCKADGILAGVELAEIICKKVSPTMQVEHNLPDGSVIKKGDVAFKVFGEVKDILRAERLLLNFMQRMSGIATNTNRYVKAVEGTNTKILDTRKTTPNLRYFEKWAVRIGGGHNHRFGLYDMIMVKDNHIDFCGGIKQAIQAVKEYQQKNNLNLRVEIEARSLDDVQAILDAGNVHRVMFDNFSVEYVRKGVELVAGKIETEISGGITLDTIRPYAEAGADFISVGALTHSSVSLDLSLKAF
jgi:nicotinate-nucleotide pyrophosphorylase (carboxylating)